MNEESPTTRNSTDPKTLRKVWYLNGPFYQYVEDVKALANKHGLRIIDGTVTTDRTDAAESVPSVTLRPEYAPKVVAPAPAPAPAEEAQPAVSKKR